MLRILRSFGIVNIVCRKGYSKYFDPTFLKQWGEWKKTESEHGVDDKKTEKEHCISHQIHFPIKNNVANACYKESDYTK